MNTQLLQEIINLSQNRINFLSHVTDWNFYKGHQTYLDALEDEIVETKEEIASGKKVYLEDELWDIFWDYICLLHSLEDEWRIDVEKVFERCYRKFSERIHQDGSSNGVWQEVKQKQKAELAKEHLNSH